MSDDDHKVSRSATSEQESQQQTSPAVSASNPSLQEQLEAELNLHSGTLLHDLHIADTEESASMVLDLGPPCDPQVFPYSSTFYGNTEPSLESLLNTNHNGLFSTRNEFSSKCFENENKDGLFQLCNDGTVDPSKGSDSTTPLTVLEIETTPGYTSNTAKNKEKKPRHSSNSKKNPEKTHLEYTNQMDSNLIVYANASESSAISTKTTAFGQAQDTAANHSQSSYVQDLIAPDVPMVADSHILTGTSGLVDASGYSTVDSEIQRMLNFNPTNSEREEQTMQPMQTLPEKCFQERPLMYPSTEAALWSAENLSVMSTSALSVGPLSFSGEATTLTALPTSKEMKIEGFDAIQTVDPFSSFQYPESHFRRDALLDKCNEDDLWYDPYNTSTDVNYNILTHQGFAPESSHFRFSEPVPFISHQGRNHSYPSATVSTIVGLPNQRSKSDSAATYGTRESSLSELLTSKADASASGFVCKSPESKEVREDDTSSPGHLPMSVAQSSPVDSDSALTEPFGCVSESDSADFSSENDFAAVENDLDLPQESLHRKEVGLPSRDDIYISSRKPPKMTEADYRLASATLQAEAEGSLAPLVKDELRYKILQKHHRQETESKEKERYPDNEARERRRLINRRSAKRCRQKRHSQYMTLRQEYLALMSESTNLKYQVAKLTREKDQLKELLRQHLATCRMAQGD